jgi:NAD(P)-dependent dehydrogenase (short-subunit alcohol dehydrogenase family)
MVMIITGGGRGIGAATARLAALRGYRICVNYLRDAASAEAVARETGGIAVQADVAREGDVLRMFERVDRELGPLSVLVNNAATLEPQMRLEAIDSARMHRMFATNAIGPMLCAREAVRRMSTRHGGRGGVIVNVSSAATRSGSPGEYVDYAASKGALEVFTTGLAAEVALENIRVVGVRPGFIYTELHAKGGEPGRVDRLKALVPMRRGGRAEEVAAAIVWLASPEASYTTGTFLDVSGGR